MTDRGQKAGRGIRATVFLLLWLAVPFVVSAEVTVFDALAAVGRPVWVSAQTRGRFLAQGGVMAHFTVDGTPVGSRLSGGDGYAYMEYTPESPGLKTVEARTDKVTGSDRGTGLVLAVTPAMKIVVVEITGMPDLYATFGVRQEHEEKKGAAEDLRKISRNYTVVYGAGAVGIEEARKRVHKKGFPESAILTGKRGQTCEDIKESGLTVAAAIGTGEFLRHWAQCAQQRFSFEEEKGGGVVTVESWEEVERKLVGNGNKVRSDVHMKNEAWSKNGQVLQ